MTTDFGSEDGVDFGSEDVASTVAIQADGKVIVAGSTIEDPREPKQDFALARYTSSGSLDASFGIGGTVTTDFGGTIETAAAVAVQADGSILVAGSTANDTGIDQESAFAVARYKMDGSLDPSFGTDGRVITDFGFSEFGASALALQTDGKIVVVGGAGGDFALDRYAADGSLDPEFGNRGKVTTDFHSGDAQATDVAIQEDGKILVVGSTFAPERISLALARYTTGGALDRSFGNAGRVTRASGPVFARAVATLRDGKILVAGSTEEPFGGTSGPGDFAVVRYTNKASSIVALGISGW